MHADSILYICLLCQDGRTALDMAKELSCKEIVDLLTPTQSQSTNGVSPIKL